ncbi:hypothetical protein ACUXST_001688 [Sphingomonas sp. F9_3S_D5_B_2]
MADTNVHAEGCTATAGPVSSAIREAFIAFRRTKAEWDAYQYATPGDQQRDGSDVDYCGANSMAVDALLLTPAENLHDLALKLSVYDAEEIDDMWETARPITALLPTDAQRLTVDKQPASRV